MVNDMDREEGPGKNLFYKKSTSRKALKFPVENVFTEISKGPFPPTPYHDGKISVFLFRDFLSLWKIED